MGSTILYNTLNYAIVSRHQINTCTVLYSSVLYCIKIRKFAHKEYRTKNVSKTEVHSIPLWILSGYTRELANKREPTLQARSNFGLWYTPCILALILQL